MVKAIRISLGILLAVGMIFTVFFSSFRAVVLNREYMDREMDKLGIAEAVAMTPEDLSDVFDEILQYLEGDRENLIIYTQVDGEVREAFNEREKLHMVDVLVLFEKGFGLYYFGLLALAGPVLAAVFWKKERRALVGTYVKSIAVGLGAFLATAGGLTALIASDFNRYFTLFHEIFFDNDLWLLDPRTDLMINMLPEQFFFDVAMSIGVIFLVAAVMILAAAVVAWAKIRKRNAYGK